MPIIYKSRGSDGGVTTSMAQHLITEDPRPGHNVFYIGHNLQAYDSVTLKPLLGLRGNHTYGYHGGPDQFIFNNATGHYNMPCGWLMLAGKPGVASQTGSETVGFSTAYWYNNVEFAQAHCMDHDAPGNSPSAYYDYGDGTKNVMLRSTTPSGGWGNGWQSYGAHMMYDRVPDDKELYEQVMSYQQSWSSQYNPRIGGSHQGWSSVIWNGNFGAVFLCSYGLGNHYNYRNHVHVQRMNATLGSIFSTDNDHFAQGCGISDLDGSFIYIEKHASSYKPNFRIKKYTQGGGVTTLFSNHNTSDSQPPFASYNTTYGYTGANTSRHNTGTLDAYVRYGTKWVRHSGSLANMWFSYHPHVTTGNQAASGTIYLDAIRWDKSNDTFTGAGINGPSGQYATLIHYDQSRSTSHTGYSNQNWMDPVTAGVGSCNSGSYTTTAAGGLWAEMHGAVHQNAQTGVEYPLDCSNISAFNSNGNLVSVFPAYGPYGHVDNEPRARTIWTTAVRTYYGVGNAGESVDRAYTIVPETPREWFFLDEGKTLIAAICHNNTYIYQCRVANQNAFGANGTSNLSLNKGFNATINTSNDASWIHTATIPYQVLQIGVDKLGRIWYVTWEADKNYYGYQSSLKQFAKQLWMVTYDTPFRVVLTGNITTDTINYTGSNISKTLTIEAWNIKGARLASDITLTITGTDAQFDNGTQTKTVTTSPITTVSQTITITGSGTFNISASYGT